MLHGDLHRSGSSSPSAGLGPVPPELRQNRRAPHPRRTPQRQIRRRCVRAIEHMLPVAIVACDPLQPVNALQTERRLPSFNGVNGGRNPTLNGGACFLSMLVAWRRSTKSLVAGSRASGAWRSGPLTSRRDDMLRHGSGDVRSHAGRFSPPFSVGFTPPTTNGTVRHPIS